jgi:transcriptional regulator with XRE-family HTH domain
VSDSTPASNRIRELRCERGLSQPQLAKALLAQALLDRDPRVGASSPDASTIGRWEQDGSIPDEQTIVLAEFFGVAATYLLGLTPQPPEEDDGSAVENELAAVVVLHPPK